MRKALVAIVAGAAMVLAFSPFDLLPVALVALAVLTHLWVTARSARAAAALGFLFGLGLFLTGVSWVYISLHRFGAMPAPLAAFATLGFCAILALYPALAGWAQAKLRAGPALRAALVIPAAWTLAEALRATLFTGFPWLTLGSAAVGTPLAGFSPLGGAYGTSFATAVGAGLLWCVALGQARWRAAAAFAVIGVAGAVLRDVPWTEPVGAPFSASVLQGNVPQGMKFDPQRYALTLQSAIHALRLRPGQRRLPFDVRAERDHRYDLLR